MEDALRRRVAERVEIDHAVDRKDYDERGGGSAGNPLQSLREVGDIFAIDNVRARRDGLLHRPDETHLGARLPQLTDQEPDLIVGRRDHDRVDNVGS